MGFIAQNAVADVIVVRNLHPVEKNYVFKLGRVANHAAATDYRTATDKGAVPYFGIFTDDARRAQICRRGDFRAFVNPNAFGDFFVSVAVKTFA